MLDRKLSLSALTFADYDEVIPLRLLVIQLRRRFRPYLFSSAAMPTHDLHEIHCRVKLSSAQLDCVRLCIYNSHILSSSLRVFSSVYTDTPVAAFNPAYTPTVLNSIHGIFVVKVPS